MAKKGDIPAAQIKLLEDLLRLPENRECADCGARGPRWASTNLGIFICMRCSGIHRSIGVHITKVKSVNLDKWLPEQLEFFQTMGNGRAKAFYEASVPSGYPRPNQSDNYGVEQWIRDKYERKCFVPREGGGGQRDQQKERRPNNNAAPAAAPKPAISAQAQQPLFDPFFGDQPAHAQPHQPNGNNSNANGNGNFASFPPPPGSHAQPPRVVAPPSRVAAPPAGNNGGAFQAEFGAFQSASSQSSDPFAAFGAPAQPQPPAQAPALSKDSIMSLYNQPPAGPSYGAPPQGHYGAPPAGHYGAPPQQQFQVPPGYVAVMNPSVPGGIMFVPAAGMQPTGYYQPPAGNMMYKPQ